METADETLEPLPEQPLIISEESKLYLVQAGKWATFLGIVGFVFTGLIMFVAISSTNNLSNMQRFPMAGMFPFLRVLLIVITVVYVIMAVVTFFFSLYLYKFGTTVKEGILYNDSIKTNAAFGKLKSFFKLWGVTTIIVLILYALMFLFIIFGGLTMASLMGNGSFKLNSPLVP
ncbi:hypothetical protein IDJ77_10480 [Mucilaginibacter sp. ZT4R22]|uniref:Uncharacterized protein n=1 Tax=Mucilaginibacter pankratovii TaxID=2772110 RepID=A0ABR7WS73_9SPHI|nr:DUF5362 family protein [Mucilaginibacter pankratovii]MBD1364234.1 hypothetical protein [Mucilaginibacter pankratovii]